MRYIADLHIHSKYSRACSANLTLSNIAAWAKAKGLDVVATGDFTHPAWLAEIEMKLEPAESGLFRIKPAFSAEDGAGNYEAAPRTAENKPVRFMLATEISCIYKKNGRTRRLHLLLFAPSVAAVKKIIAALESLDCNLRSDGRPILGLDAKEIVRIAQDADPDCLVVPAHAWTPWFSVFGSESGFDSLEECFEELTPHICAIETGLSSDPEMNWRLSKLDRITLISNSDAHGLRNLGREANAFDLDELSYGAIVGLLRRRDAEKFLYTIEFFPEEGKYHVDGHRVCDFFCGPEETARRGGLCPKCCKPLTRGVLGRVHKLADRSRGERPAGAPDFRRIVPLEEVIAEAIGKTKAAKSVFSLYKEMIAALGSEFAILLDMPIDRIASSFGSKMAEAVTRVRDGRLKIKPGYDGVYGRVRIFDDKPSRQSRLDL